ncbi:MAG: dTMP kinase [Pseudomonadota bacterium]
MTERRGFFITFEGGDGVGKSTQINRLAERLREAGRDVVTTREPGGSPGAEAIRALLVEGDADRWSPLTEALLMVAARRDHLEKVILPGLARGAVVISDRFADSTMAYQGVAGALGRDKAAALHALAVGDNNPDLTIILDLPIEEGLKRARNRAGEETRFESKGEPFQRAVRHAFLEIARDEPARCVVVNAAGPIEETAQTIWRAVDGRLRA